MPNLKNKINVFAQGAWQRMSHQGAGRPSFVSTKPKATVKRTPSACNQQPAGQPKRRSRLVARQPVSRCSTEIRVGSPHPSLDSVSSALNRLIATLDLQQPGMSSPPPRRPTPSEERASAKLEMLERRVSDLETQQKPASTVLETEKLERAIHCLSHTLEFLVNEAFINILILMTCYCGIHLLNKYFFC